MVEGRTSVLLDLGSIIDPLAKQGIVFLRQALRRPGFRDASGLTGNTEHLGPVESWGKCHRSSSGATTRAHEGFSRLQSSFGYSVPGSISSWDQPFHQGSA